MSVSLKKKTLAPGKRDRIAHASAIIFVRRLRRIRFRLLLGSRYFGAVHIPTETQTSVLMPSSLASFETTQPQ
jgi:hypothetical protein